MLEWFEKGFTTSVSQMLTGVLSFVLLAYLLHLVGTHLKRVASELLGWIQRVLAMPGEFCRNVGVSIACLLMGVRMTRHVIANDASGNSTSLTHSRVAAGTPLGFIRNLVILTAPIWFGSLILGIITLTAGGTGMLPDVEKIGDGGMMAYVTAVVTEAVSMLCSLLVVWHWTSPFCLFCLLCFVSIASEITIDTRGLWAIKTGLFGLFVLLIIANSIPGLSEAMAALGKALRPIGFTIQVILLFVILFNTIALVVLRCLVRLLHRGKGRK